MPQPEPEVSEHYAYVGREPCGHVVCAIVDSPLHKSDTAKEIGRWIRSGLTLDHITVEAARSLLWTEEHEACKTAAKAANRAAQQERLLQDG